MDFTSFSPAVVLVTVVFIALAPFVAVMVTSFTKIVVVLSLLRNALGLQQVPPNVVINGLAIVLSAYVMSPVIFDTHAAVTAHMAGQPPPPQIQAQIEARAIARAERIAARTAAAPRPTGDATAPGNDAAAAGEPPPASPAAADALRAEADARAAGEGGNAPPAADTARSPLFANVDNGSGAMDAMPDPVTTTDAADQGPVVITATGTPQAPTPAGVPMDAERMMGIFQASKEPLRGFLIHHSNDAERAFFLRSAQRLLPADRRDDIDVDDFMVVIPAFTVSELTTAFQSGFLIFLPFLIIDLVGANILLALGMMMLSPTTISLPFKLLLFVLVDGWAKLVHGLVRTYGGG